MISPGRQRVKIKKYLYNLYFYDFHIIRFAFYTCLSSLYNYHLKYISLIILLGEVQKFLGEVLKISGGAVIPGGGAHLPAPLPKIRPCYNMYSWCARYVSDAMLDDFDKEF